jgi:hypothetical protein
LPARARGAGRDAVHPAAHHRSLRATPLAAATLLLTFALAAMAADPTPSFSARLDALWDYSRPAESEARFRAELAAHPAGSREALETSTQIARTQSLRRQFAAADATLDAVAPKLDDAPPRVRVRYLLERGRTRNSAGDKAAAVALFTAALDACARDTLPDADFYRVDALHMLGIAAPAADQLDWNRKALAAAEGSADPRARGWAASLDNNIGWTYFNNGDAATALAYWKKALAEREAAGKPVDIRIAKWMVARGLRATGALDDAQAIQMALAVETERANAPDGYVYEELAEIALARGDAIGAAPWAAKAHALLKDDPSLAANEAPRLARLAAVAKGDAR